MPTVMNVNEAKANFSKSGRAAISDAPVVYVSPVTAWEIAAPSGPIGSVLACQVIQKGRMANRP